jgi:hypothetical protein
MKIFDVPDAAGLIPDKRDVVRGKACCVFVFWETKRPSEVYTIVIAFR